MRGFGTHFGFGGEGRGGKFILPLKPYLKQATSTFCGAVSVSGTSTLTLKP